ncbi:MAG TPA: bifunctional phosphoribosylaminoimidazolecarboxamide formyltransferase/IMP cyclohydrolase [Candidatus Eisenbacteria bacterium]|nr:bifunctional phosphoribosylaminoimidazolecarboxamide formyltransferase/IMP cyclohydrolase [Candidatus Eisenbacteria bacterium]
MNAIRISRALISVSDKTGLLELAHGLGRHGVKLLSTGGTATALRDAGFGVRDVSEVTGFPELFGGRVKTLHPAVHGGILYRRGHTTDEEERHRHGIVSIDLVVVNLYPFESTVARPGVRDEEAVEKIDIGGPALIRAAAKNHRHVVVVVEPAQYGAVIDALDQNEGAVPEALAREFAGRAYARTAEYDASIARYLSSRAGVPAAAGAGEARSATGVPGFAVPSNGQGSEASGGERAGTLPDRWAGAYRKRQTLRYGENPGQEGALYAAEAGGGAVERLTQVRGKTLSYNNLLDIEAAVSLLREFGGRGGAVVVKHRNPSGAALAESAADAIAAARDGDSLSAFGGILGLNRPLDDAALDVVGKFFFEVIATPEIRASEARMAELRKNLVVLELGALLGQPAPAVVVRGLLDGLLAETALPAPRFDQWKSAAKRAPTEAETRDLRFAWSVTRHVVSNAIVIAKGERTLGIGAGQSSRVDAVRLALWKAERSGHDVRGAVLCSDAFFPFPDSVELAAKAGIAAVAHPGGSVRDGESTAAADAAGMALVLTGERCFLH